MNEARNPKPLWQWPLALVGFLLGLGGTLWWQAKQDEQTFRSMKERPDEDFS